VKIGELARASGLTTKTIRYYELEGLLPQPPRTASGYRMYANGDLQRLSFVARAKRVGLTLREIREILLLSDRDEPTCGHVRSLLDEKLAEIDKAISDLRTVRAQVAEIRGRAGELADCRPSGGLICSIIEER
jgi:DNA-binding transcriptional MerR regulator